MKAICLTEKGDLATKKWGTLDCVDLPMPKIEKDDDILIKIAYSSICGSDPLMLNGNMDVPVGIGFGHEMSGVIVDMGKGCNKRGLKIGDKVTGCFVHFAASVKTAARAASSTARLRRRISSRRRPNTSFGARIRSISCRTTQI